MSKASQENHGIINARITNHTETIHNNYQCSQLTELLDHLKTSNSSVVNCHVVDDVPFSYFNDQSISTSVVDKVTVINHVSSDHNNIHEHDNGAVDNSLCCVSQKASQPNLLTASTGVSIQCSTTKNTESVINTNVPTSPTVVYSFGPQCNGSVQNSVLHPFDVSVPSEQSGDINGRSGSHTPMSSNEPDRAKMDLFKLDGTIDYILSLARSDEPFDDIFSLPCRTREHTHPSSPTPRVNTPSSGLLPSPQSPIPSPPPNKILSPMLGTAAPQLQRNTHGMLTAIPRYLVDQGSTLLRLPSVSSHGLSTQSNNHQGLSFVQVYPESPNLARGQPMEHGVGQSGTHVVFHPVIHDAHNHVSQSGFTGNAVASGVTVHRHSSLLTPDMSNTLPHFPTQVVQTTVPRPNTFAAIDPCRTPNRPMVTSQPDNALVIASQPVVHGALVTSLNLGTSNSQSTTVSRSPINQKSPVPFRQPIVPANTYSISQVPVCEHLGVATPSLAPGPIRTPALGITGSKRRGSTVTGGSKRRKTPNAVTQLSSTAGSRPLDPGDISPLHRTAQLLPVDYLEKLKFSDFKPLVSAPVLRPYSSVLPPMGGVEHNAHLMNSLEEDRLILRRGLKYTRGSMVNSPMKCSTETQAYDNYVVQHHHGSLPQGPIVHRPTHAITHYTQVCPSPEPASFENNMMTLFSSMHKSPSTSKPESYTSQEAKVSDSSALHTLLPVFSNPFSNSSKQDPDRCTPPLPLFHMPNPRLICQPIYLGNGNNGRASTYNCISDPCRLSTPVSPALDTTEIQRVSRLDSTWTGKINEAIHPMFTEEDEFTTNKFASAMDVGELKFVLTITPPMLETVPKIVHQIRNLMGVSEGAITYQLSRCGAFLFINQKHVYHRLSVNDLECRLQERFNPLTIRLEKCEDRTSRQYNSTSHGQDCVTSITSSMHVQNKFTSEQKPDLPSFPVLDCPKFLEEQTNMGSLISGRRHINVPCINCDKLVHPQAACHKTNEDLSTLIGLSMRSDVADLTFCSESCVSDFVRLLTDHKLQPLEHPYASGSTNAPDTRQQVIISDTSARVPVLLQNHFKQVKSHKRHGSSLAASLPPGKRRASTGSSRHRLWHNTRWRHFSTDALPQTLKYSCDVDPLQTLISKPVHLSTSNVDERVCALCELKGDAPENGPGRLIPLDINRWLHVNCSLWCHEVYETVGGSLNKVHTWLKKAEEITCSHCGLTGAGLPCYNPRCTYYYHVPCAISIGCMFFTDRGMYCPQHQPKDSHPMQLPSLLVDRRVYIARDENEQVSDIIHEEDRSHVVRIGSLCLLNVGQLLPHQIENSSFHSRRHIYPVGFRTLRIYWSMRKPNARARYFCEIREADGHPLFCVTAVDFDLDDECVTGETCDAVWQIILCRIASLREENGLVRLFTKHLKGEDLYGLSEPHVVRAVESLPGVDSLRDYAFNFGRMELIAEMPLAINPTGCARSEPKMNTYVKRSMQVQDHSNSATSRTSNTFPGLKRSLYPGLSGSALSDTVSKQNQSSRSQQYRRLKNEAMNNVILGRSRIQGIGLFAARDFEPQTIVIEYIGELIRQELANKREKEYEYHKRGIYMFRLDDDTVIDATMCGGLARYINHSCQPNCYAEYLSFGDRAHIVIITTRRIEKGEELCYDYNFDVEDRSSKIPCLCRAPNCRKWMN